MLSDLLHESAEDLTDQHHFLSGWESLNGVHVDGLGHGNSIPHGRDMAAGCPFFDAPFGLAEPGAAPYAPGP